MMLRFDEAKDNAKLSVLEREFVLPELGGKLRMFSMRAGHTCPFARECLSMAVDTPQGRRIKDGKFTKYRCFAASQDAQYPMVYDKRYNNEQILDVCKKSYHKGAEMIAESIPEGTAAIRIHVSGDFKYLSYMRAWLAVAREFPNMRFYAYTKALTHWVTVRASVPENLIFTASYGGTHDHLIAEHRLRYALVVPTNEAAKLAGLKVDHMDLFAIEPGPSFALLIHGVQPSGSLGAEWVKQYKEEQGITRAGTVGYGR